MTFDILLDKKKLNEDVSRGIDGVRTDEELVSKISNT